MQNIFVLISGSFQLAISDPIGWSFSFIMLTGHQATALEINAKALLPLDYVVYSTSEKYVPLQLSTSS